MERLPMLHARSQLQQALLWLVALALAARRYDFWGRKKPWLSMVLL
jgi:hypothetical protein